MRENICWQHIVNILILKYAQQETALESGYRVNVYIFTCCFVYYLSNKRTQHLDSSDTI